MAHEVFICFSSQDQKVADAVLAKLEGEKIHCWISSRDMGAGWFTQKLLDAVNESRILVLIFSANSNSSEYCINEVHAAFSKKSMIIPFVIDPATPSGDMAFYLQRFQRIDAQTPPLEKNLQRLANEVKTILSQFKTKEEVDTKEKARQEAVEKDRQQAEATRTKKEAEEAIKAREAAPKAAKKAEQTVKEKKWQETKPAKSKALWLWLSIGAVVIAVIVIALKFAVFSTGSTIDDGNEPTTPVLTGNNTTPTVSTTPPTSAPTQSTTTPPQETTEPLLPPTEYVKIGFAPTTFEKSEITGNEIFSVFLSGNFTCLKDIPYPVNGLTIVPQITARNTATQIEVMLITSNNITSDSIPLRQGETASFVQTLSLQFLENTPTGDYVIYLNTDKIKVNIGLWVDIDEFFQLLKQYLGTVKYNGS